MVAPASKLAGCCSLDVLERHREVDIRRATLTLVAVTFAMLSAVVAAFFMGALWTAVILGVAGGVVSIRLEQRLTRLRGPAPSGFFRLASFVVLCVGFQLFAPAVWCLRAVCELVGGLAGHVH